MKILFQWAHQERSLVYMVFGLYGLFLALLLTKNIDIPHESRKNFLSSTGMFILYNLVFGFSVKGIDNAAHIGGLVSGFVLGLAYFPATRSPLLARIISVAIIFLVVLIVAQAPKFISDKYGEFQRAVSEFSKNEEKAMWMYKEEPPDKNSYDITIYRERLQREGVFLWKENLAILSSLNEMPDYLQQRVDLLKRYSELRIKSCEAMAAVATDSSTENLAQIDSIGLAIDNTIKALQDLNKETK
jgi:rhomboid protease GluP